MRAALLEELGLFGVRLAITLLRGSIATPDALADELVRRSGLQELERLVDVHFRRRSDVVRAAGAVRTVEQVLRALPMPGDGRVWAHLERVRLASHDLAELDLLARLRAVDGPLPRGLQAEAARLLGAEGTAVAERLGLPADAGEDEHADGGARRGGGAGGTGPTTRWPAGRRSTRARCSPGPPRASWRASTGTGETRTAGRTGRLRWSRRRGREDQSAPARNQARDERLSSAPVARTSSPACTRKAMRSSSVAPPATKRLGDRRSAAGPAPP